jgi:acetyl-CoA carboxylase carboxyl transferase subunit alpha
MKDPRDFERPILELEAKIENISLFGEGQKREKELATLQKKLEKLRKETFSKLTPWQVVQVARHPKRPYALDYIEGIFTDFIELHGDRAFADDPAIVAGFARFHGRPVCVIGHQKGRDTKQKIYRNFGMPRPEGYRKALRIMRMAEKFGMPIITLIDTPGAYPGMDAEERGQAEAIAANLRAMALLRTPILVTVTGEGGSGGALALGIGDRVNMLQYAIYSVISPEGCAAILWKDATQAEAAAAALKLTAQDLLELDLIDRVIEEPLGGAHVAPGVVFESLGKILQQELDELADFSEDDLIEARYKKFRAMGNVLIPGSSPSESKQAGSPRKPRRSAR